MHIMNNDCFDNDFFFLDTRLEITSWTHTFPNKLYKVGKTCQLQLCFCMSVPLLSQLCSPLNDLQIGAVLVLWFRWLHPGALWETAEAMRWKGDHGRVTEDVDPSWRAAQLDLVAHRHGLSDVAVVPTELPLGRPGEETNTRCSPPTSQAARAPLHSGDVRTFPACWRSCFRWLTGEEDTVCSSSSTAGCYTGPSHNASGRRVWACLPDAFLPEDHYHDCSTRTGWWTGKIAVRSHPTPTPPPTTHHPPNGMQ